mgnify:CR=1 FL=1
MSMRIKLFVALPSEFPKEKAPLGVDVIYTGVGKVNAAIKATEILKNADPSNHIYVCRMVVFSIVDIFDQLYIEVEWHYYKIHNTI